MRGRAGGRRRGGDVTVAAVENRAREVGIALLDFGTATITLYQFIERQRYNTSRAIIRAAFACATLRGGDDDDNDDANRGDNHDEVENEEEEEEDHTREERGHFGACASGVMILCDAKVQNGLNLNSALKEEIENLEVEEVLTKRSTFDDSTGRVLLSRVAAKHKANATESMTLGVKNMTHEHGLDAGANNTGRSRSFDIHDGDDKYYLCFAAAAALITFFESETKGTILGGAVTRVKLLNPEHFCIIDNAAIEGLHLVHQKKRAGGVNRSAAATPSLLALLGTGLKTNGGKRLLRQNIVQPPRDLVTITARLDAVGELVSNELLFVDAAKLIANLPTDLEDAVIGAMSQPSLTTTPRPPHANKLATTIRKLLRLKDALELVAQVAPSLHRVESRLLVTIRDVCANPAFDKLRESIADIIGPEVSADNRSLNNRAQLCFALRSGVDGMLDVTRECFTEITETINMRASKYREEYDMPDLKLGYSSTKQFYLSFKSDSQRCPKDFQLINVKGSNCYATTQDLISLNIRLQQVSLDCLHLTEKHLSALIDRIRDSMDVLANLSESLALFDMLTGFAGLVHASHGTQAYTKPIFDPRASFVLRDARHPLLDPHGDKGFVTNNVHLSRHKSMVIVQGANMRVVGAARFLNFTPVSSGKTCYTVTAALIAVMAHIGCFVPAAHATLWPMDRIMTRLAHGDDIQTSSSSFMAEMRDCAFILGDATDSSLVIIDELGRSTSTLEGLGIAWAVLEELICASVPTIVCTHMSLLSMLAKAYPVVRNLHMAVMYDADTDEVNYVHKLAEGRLEMRAHYGIALANKYLPRAIVEDALRVADHLSRGELKLQARFEQRATLESGVADPIEALVIDVAQKLHDLSFSYTSMESDELGTHLMELASRFGT